MSAPLVIAYKGLTTMADGYDALCRNCDDMTVYECTTEDCGGTLCVCCMDGCDECGAELVFS